MRRENGLPYGALAAIRPVGIYHRMKPLIIRYFDSHAAGDCDLIRYDRGMIPAEQVRRFRRVLSIEKGYFEYEYFNVCFLNNMLSLCLKAVSEGFLPRIHILNSKGVNLWEMFFEQPFRELTEEGKEIVPFTRPYFEAFPAWRDVSDPERIRLYGNLYRDFAVFKPKIRSYIQEEADGVWNRGKILGVLCRGTDYTRTRPKGHPVQPRPEDILRKSEEILEGKGYDYVYLATEDSMYDTLFRERFQDRLLINQRQYYDTLFDREKLRLIKDVHFDRENDEFLKGLEYLSSLFILSGCSGLVAGNCGGTEAAVFWNQGKYDDQFIFDLGEYE